MLKKVLSGKIKHMFFYALIGFLLLGFAYISIATIIEFNANEVKKSEISSNEEQLVDVEKTIIANKVNRLVTDLLYISDSVELNESFGEDYSQLEKQWIAFSNRKYIYDQIRFIDTTGQEIVRVNYSSDGAYTTKGNALQNIRDRYYYINTKQLKENQIYISKLDLNVENDKVEVPEKPMLRLITPVFGKDGKIRGIVVLNYLASDMLNQVQKIASTSIGNLFMNNENGYWLYNGEDKTKEWGFMYGDTENVSFQNEFPEEWKSIKENGKGSLITDKGVFTYTSVLATEEIAATEELASTEDIAVTDGAVKTDKEAAVVNIEAGANTEDNKRKDVTNTMVLGEGDWYIISYISPSSHSGRLFFENSMELVVNVVKENGIVFVLLFSVSFIFALLITFNNIEKDKIKYYSEFDMMTGIYNRRAGFEKLNQIYKDATKKDGEVCICFIDINGLKEVNDFLGHEKGDELIISIVQGIRKNLRDTDFVARLGGDEFLIIFTEMNEEEAEKAWRRISQEYEIINETENRDYTISVSHGIVEFKFNEDERMDLVINRADEKMYNEKREIKKELIVIRK